MPPQPKPKPKYGGFGSGEAASFNWQKQQEESEGDAGDPDIDGFPGAAIPFPEVPLFGWVRPDQEWDPLKLIQASGGKIKIGDRVVVHQLQRHSRLNGLTGVVDESLGDDRWRVNFDSDIVGDKGLKAKNLQRIDGSRSQKEEEDEEPEVEDVPQTSTGSAEPGKAKKNKAPASWCPPPPEGTALKAILKAARLDWKEKDLQSVREKLEKVGIETGADLLLAVKVRNGADLNLRLKGSGEKAFAASTLQGLTNPVEATAKGKTAAAPQAPLLPCHNFEVVHDMANVREEPKLASKAIAAKMKGDTVSACLETFDGWVRLDGEAGWMMKDMQGQYGLGQLLSPVAAAPKLAYQGPILDGPQAFEVVFKHVAVRASPLRNAMMLQLKMKGEEVLAGYQTYDGWIYIPELDGWMLTADAQLGQLLRHKEIDESIFAGETDFAG